MITATHPHEPNPAFTKWCLGYSGCDGGDIGSPDSRSVWACGIEWGGAHDARQLEREFNENASVPPRGYNDWNANLHYHFNRQLMKLLAAMRGRSVSEYRQFAASEAPFVAGSRGYFKMNLFPIAFRNTDARQWHNAFSEITGFDDKAQYLEWCREKRMPLLNAWCNRCTPEMVICVGKTYIQDFSAAFLNGEQKVRRETIDDREFSWARNSNGTLVVILPFMLNRHGLVRNTSIQKFGERILQLRMASRA